MAFFLQICYLCGTMDKVTRYLELVKFSHTIFALPFALIGFTLAVKAEGFDWWLLLKVVICMVAARSAAMGFNRWADRRFDALNPRTASREIPSGAISARAALWFVVLCVLVFIGTAATFNTLTLLLSPVALAVIMGYSYTKRFTPLCHLILGLGIGIAPSAAYIAVTGELTLAVVLYSLLVFTWIAGFDIIYALADAEFDRGAGLHSIPQYFGLKRALIISVLLHVVTAFTVVTIGLLTGGVLYWIGASCFIAMLVYQHLIVSPSDLSRISLAFGTTNGVASVIFAIFVILGYIFQS